MKKYDLFVIGTGVAGTIIANKCAAEGYKTGITDDKPFGGTCSQRGCIPKKVLVEATHVVQSAKNLKGKGIYQTPTVDWKELMAFKNSFIDPIPPKKEKTFNKNGIVTYHGKARFISKNQIQIGEEVIVADKFVIATGARPRQLEIPGADYALSSDDFLELKELPQSMLFIGGGYIALEFAHIAARCGCKVTVMDMVEKPLANFEQDVVEHLIGATEALGIKLVMNTKVAEIKKTGGAYTVIGDNDGNRREFNTDVVFNTSGRVPAIFDMDLEKAEVKYSPKGIEVNDFMQSVSTPSIYAAGDNTATEGLPLTPLATSEAHVLAANILQGNHKKPDYSVMPTVVFTLPPLATVGMTEKQACEKKLNIKINHDSVPHWYSAKHRGEDTYAYKVIVDKDSDQILGAHIIGPHADETINLFALAIKAGTKAEDIKKMPFVFPSLVADVNRML